MLTKLRGALTIAFSLSMTLFLSGCDKMLILNPKGVVAIAEKRLLIDSLLLMSIIVVPVIIITLLIAFKYRSSNVKAKYSPDWSHSTILEAGWWAIPVVIILVLGVMTWRSTHELDPYKPLNSNIPPVTIQVISLQWRWLFIYPQQNIATLNFVEFPVDTPINFLITSDAPMNSFMIQQLAGQIYAMAGMQTKLHLMANQVGDYNGRSVSFSGDGFANMTFIARATTEDAFNQWVKSVKQSPDHLTMDAYNQLALPSKDGSVQYFSTVANNLFNAVIMKFMMPMPKPNPENPSSLQHMQSLTGPDYHSIRNKTNS